MKLQKLNTDSDYFFRENFLLQFESQERKEKGSKWCFSSFAKNLYIIFFQYFAWDYYVKAGNSLWRFLGKYLILGFSGQKGPKWTQSKVLRSKLLLWFSLEKSCTRVLGQYRLKSSYSKWMQWVFSDFKHQVTAAQKQKIGGNILTKFMIWIFFSKQGPNWAPMRWVSQIKAWLKQRNEAANSLRCIVPKKN